MSRHVGLVIHALHGGGAERVAAQMANLWAGQGDRVTVITLDSTETDIYRVDDQVHRVGLRMMGAAGTRFGAIRNNRRRIGALRSVIRKSKFDCVVSLTDQMNLLTLLAARTLPVPVIIAEHSDPRHQRMGTIREYFRRRVYPRAAAIVVLTEAVGTYFRDQLEAPPIHVIPNGISRPPDSALALRSQVKPLVVSMGRLSSEKGFGTLIEAFGQVAPRQPAWQLAIAGEGPQRAMLGQLIDRQQLAQRVNLVGWVDDPYRFLASAAIYVLSSRYEGFPVSLLEAMAMGLAVVSFDCDSGPREIVRHMENGLLVSAGDKDQLAQSIAELMSDTSLRQRLGNAAREIVDEFSPDLFAQRWNKVLSEVLA